MRVTLISPYGKIDWDFTTRILSAVLKKEGCETRLLFPSLSAAKCYPEDKGLKRVVELSKDSDLIGISVMTNFFSGVVQITQILKKKLNIPIIWGGIHPTIRPNECLEHADMVCIGEGEETLVKLVRKIKKCDDISDIVGLGFRAGGRVVINNPSPLIQDLDLTPFPDYSCEDDYLLKGKSVRKIDKNLLKDYMTSKIYSDKKRNYTTYHTITSRGCPFECSYCCNSAFTKMYPDQKVVRKRSVGNIINELIGAKRTLSFINCVLINDDSFFTRTEEEIAYFAKEYKEKIGLPLWITGLSIFSFSKKKLTLLVDGGLRFIRMGIQTGSDSTKKMYKRYYSNQQIEAVAKEINKFKDKIVPPSYDIILGNPWESDDDLVKTLMLLSSLPKPYSLELFSLTLYPDTSLYLKAKKEGIIKNDIEEIYNKPYYGVKPTYLNNLFQLLQRCSSNGWCISPMIMFLLTNPKLRRLKFSQLLYYILKIWFRWLRLMRSLHKRIFLK
jgi:radical SAM superfamily enzyme YgiQ (UPF0313 family)